MNGGDVKTIERLKLKLREGEKVVVVHFRDRGRNIEIFALDDLVAFLYYFVSNIISLFMANCIKISRD